MQSGLYRDKSSNNDSTVTILWVGIICYVLGFFLPQITVSAIGGGGGDFSRFTWELLSGILILFIFISIALLYKAILKTKLYQDIKIFGIGSSLIMLIPLIEISSQLNNLNIEGDNIIGISQYQYGFGYYLLWIGLILSAVGSLKAQTTPPSSSINLPDQQAYQRNNQYYPPPQHQQTQIEQPPSDSNRTAIQNPSDTELGLDSKTSHALPTQKGLFCGNCGHNNEVGSKFCDICGQKQ